MKELKFTWKNLELALGVLGEKARLKALRVLKEAAIRDQEFEAASFIRDHEKRLSGGVSGVNKHPRKKKP